MSKKRITAQVGYEPKFSWRYLLPQYWAIWIGVFFLVILAYIPFRLRDKFAAKLASIIGRKAKKQRHRARVNLEHCFPQWTDEKKEQVIDEMFVTVTQAMLGIGEIALRSKKHIQQRGVINGFDKLYETHKAGKNIVLLVPHTWAIDASGIILHSYDMSMTAMYNPHRNPLVDWLWNYARCRYGGRMHTRQNGIKPFLAEVRQGKIGYYLPDEDFGEELSVYADFFATYKATLPGLNKMVKVSRSVVIPMFPIYDSEKGVYRLEIGDEVPISDDDLEMANTMNRIIEDYVRKTPEQYVWILRLLKTRKDGEDIYQMSH